MSRCVLRPVVQTVRIPTRATSLRETVLEHLSAKCEVVATCSEWRRPPPTRRRSEQSVISPNARCISTTSGTLGIVTGGVPIEGTRDAESKQPVRCQKRRSQRTNSRDKKSFLRDHGPAEGAPSPLQSPPCPPMSNNDNKKKRPWSVLILLGEEIFCAPSLAFRDGAVRARVDVVDQSNTPSERGFPRQSRLVSCTEEHGSHTKRLKKGPLMCIPAHTAPRTQRNHFLNTCHLQPLLTLPFSLCP